MKQNNVQKSNAANVNRTCHPEKEAKMCELVLDTNWSTRMHTHIYCYSYIWYCIIVYNLWKGTYLFLLKMGMHQVFSRRKWRIYKVWRSKSKEWTKHSHLFLWKWKVASACFEMKVISCSRSFVPRFTEKFIDRLPNKRSLAARIELRLGLNRQYALTNWINPCWRNLTISLQQC